MKRSQRVPPYLWGLIIGLLFAGVYLKVKQGMFGGRFPELTKMDDQKSQPGKPWTVNVNLASDSEWDKKDESQIALYEVANKDFITLKEFTTKEIAGGKLKMPALQSGKRYQMLTKFFFCHKVETEKCRIQGFAVNLYPDEKSEPLTINFAVGPRQ